MGRIFISYRRGETSGVARALFNELAVALGRDLRFMDVGRDALAVLIGKDWLDATTSSEQRRLDDPEDYVRREIEAALGRNIAITPVLLDGAQMPRAEQLPDAIREFAYYSGFELSPDHWASDVPELFKRLGLAGQSSAESVGDAALSTQWVPSEAFPAPARPALAQTYVGPPSSQWRRFAMAGGVVLAMAIAIAGVHYYRGGAEGNIPRAKVLLAEVPLAEAPLAEAPPIDLQLSKAPLAEVPLTEAPPVEAPPVEAPPAEAPLVEAPLVEVPLAEALPAELPPAEVRLSEVLLDEAQLAEVRPRERRAINMNSRITLRSPDDLYVVNARSRENYYYASLGSTAEVMALEAGDKPLVDGSSVTIKATENWGDEWAGRTYLGAFGDKTELYYWDYYGAKTQWIIEKVSSQPGDPIYSGDKVAIQNERFTGQYLTTHPDNYLTTTSRTPRSLWTIELAD